MQEQQRQQQSNRISGELNSNEIGNLNETAAMDATKTLIKNTDNDGTMCQSLTRSNTFVCDGIDAAQTKLLSVTHNVSVDTTSQLQSHQDNNKFQLNKERTFKRSLSPIPGETMNAAKRKSVQSILDRKVMSGPILNSTPHNSKASADGKFPFFSAYKTTMATGDVDTSHMENQQTFAMENTMVVFNTNDLANKFVPDAVKLNGASNSTMQNNNHRCTFDLTQTVIELADMQNSTQTHGDCTVATDHDAKFIDDGTFSSGPCVSNKSKIDDCDLTKTINVEKTQPIQIVSGPLNDDLLSVKKRFSLGLELPECTLDCSIELCDSSAATSVHDSSPLVNFKPHSYDLDESLGILTPDQMIEFLDTNASHASNAKIELPSSLPVKFVSHKLRIDQTPSPEELPLDPIEVKTYDAPKLNENETESVSMDIPQAIEQDGPSQSDSYSKTDQMTKSTNSKATANSFITSVTSITSLDNGYQGDGEMSRPASRGAEHSPMNVRRVHNNSRQNKLHANQLADNENLPVIRRQDPMTDSDFFTESDADDIFHRGDRRVQIIDGHMYNAQGADVFIDENDEPQNDNSCMDSSGIYTDVEHQTSTTNARNENDMSPDDGSMDTIKSSEYANDDVKSMSSNINIDNNNKVEIQQKQGWTAIPTQSSQSINALSNSSSTTTTNDSAATCLCEQKTNGGDRQMNTVITVSDASSNCSLKSLCTIHLNCRCDDEHSNASPTLKTSNSSKVKKSSPNRKQLTSSSVYNKRNEQNRNKNNEQHSNLNANVKNRGRSSAIDNNDRNLPEIKSPTEYGHGNNASLNSTTNSNNSTMTGNRSGTIQVKKTNPNKWDAVMNKIALNKTEVKPRKYDQVKSKVTSGLKRGPTSNHIKTPASEQSTTSDSGISSLTASTRKSPITLSRQSTLGITKRSIERDSSKDSQLSSSRDISTSTPGKHTKSTPPTTRSTSARKRIERLPTNPLQNGFNPTNIKIIDTPNITSTMAKPVALHKRFSPNSTIQSSTTATSSPVSEKRAALTPINKKTSSNGKRGIQIDAITTSSPVATKKSHAKEHNHQLGTINNNNSSSINNNNTTKSGTNSPKLQQTTNGDHKTQAQIATTHRNGKSSTLPGSGGIKSTEIIMTTVPQIQTKQIELNSSPPSQVNGVGESNVTLITTALSSIDSIESDAIDHCMNNLSRYKDEEKLVQNLEKADKTVVALGILVQHLTFNLKAFETPSLRTALTTAKDKLFESQQIINTMRTKCDYLENQIVTKENYFASHELALKESHDRELEKVKLCLQETKESAKEQIQTLHYQLQTINDDQMHALKACQLKADTRCNEMEIQLKLAAEREAEMIERMNNFTVTENQLRDKVQANEQQISQQFAERLQAATTRERCLNEKLTQLTKQLKCEQDRCRELEERLQLSNDENNVLRQRRQSAGSVINENATPTHNSSNSGGRMQMLFEEVESLRSVLDMKMNEISELRKQNHELQSAHDELPRALLKISTLETRLEDLTIQYQTKAEEEKELLSKNRSLQESYQQELKNRSRLSLHNEELQWKLKQNSEKFTTALNELSKSYHDRSNFLTDCKNSLYGSILETSHDSVSPKDNTTIASNISPPSSPVVKGVVEKSDSVSWVLEINDDESPEAMASRMVKRAGSFRGSFKERSPPFRRQLSLGPNVLSQSASATSIFRQHSESPKSSGSSRQIKSARNRSISLSANEPKNLRRSPSESMACGYSKWQQSSQCQASSSPLIQRNLITLVNGAIDATNNVKTNPSSSNPAILNDEKIIDSRTRSNSISTDEVDVVFPVLNQINEPVIDDDLSLLPAHKTVQKLKKRQQIKGSAGEAMVSERSYANSDDDQSFGSDIDSMSASSSNTTSPSHSESNTKHHRHHHHNHHFSIDEETFMNKIVASLNSTRSTPMEVSWSEDADNDPYAHESSA